MAQIISAEFKKLLEKSYLYHFHSTYTDGEIPVHHYFEWALQRNVQSLIFAEHIRKEPDFDIFAWIQDIKEAQKLFPGIQVCIGVEAKLLPEGDLDIPPQLLAELDMITFACHAFPTDIALYQRSFEVLFQDPRWKHFIRAWAHPGRFLKRKGFLESHSTVLDHLISLALKEDIWIEYNVRDELPPLKALKQVPEDRLLIGFDAHREADLTKFRDPAIIHQELKTSFFPKDVR